MTPRRINWKLPTLGAAAVGAAVALPLILGGGDVASAQDGHLQRFGSCADLTAFARDAAIRELRNRRSVMVEDMAAPTATAAASGGADRAASPQPGTDFSTTNVQIAGIDEPDIVKTDGRTVFAIANGRLYAVDVTGATPRVVGSLDVGGNPVDMLLTDGGLIVVGTRHVAYTRTSQVPPGGVEDAVPNPTGQNTATTLTRVDVGDPASMRVLERFGTDAEYVSARLADGAVRIVLRGNRTPAPTAEISVGGILADAAYIDQLERTPAEAWLPSYQLEDGSGRTTVSSTQIAPCESVARTAGADTGTSTLTVLTIDPKDGLDPVDRDTVMGEGAEVMMSGDNLYVTTTSYMGDGDFSERTNIHVFDTSRATRTDYRGSGTVDGDLLNQFSMDEHDGVLRVATTRTRWRTQAPTVLDGPTGFDSDSAVTTLRMQGDRLLTMGEVTGLGRGERIHSVRFMGDRGYVVTFRQTDPLYTVDLSDASHPRVTGELKIPGYSAYLHPVGEHLVLGVGQDATEWGQRTGTQVSLFDTSDPAAPRQVDKWTAPGTTTGVEWNHHAFLWWAPTATAVLPISAGWTPGSAPGTSVTDATAVALRVTPTGFERVRPLTPPAGASDTARTLRSMVVSGRLLTLSDRGITSRSVDTLDGTVWTPLG